MEVLAHLKALIHNSNPAIVNIKFVCNTTSLYAASDIVYKIANNLNKIISL